MNKLKKFIKQAVKKRISNKNDWLRFQREFAKENNINFPTYNSILAQYRKMVKSQELKENKTFERLLRIREIRTLSGIASIGVHTKPLPCPGKCIYCPSEKNMPKSYLSTQPAVMRSIAQKFDPYKMIRVRLRAYYENGHPSDKCELIVMGGTWSYHHPIYQIWFIKRCFDGFNDGLGKRVAKQDAQEPIITGNLIKDKKTETRLWQKLKVSQKLNEQSDCRLVGLTLETRPDFVNQKEIKRMRLLGATRVEMGVQSIYNPILNLNKRGHDVEATIRATKLFKDAGFKVTYHLMPGLPGSSIDRDYGMFKTIFSHSDFQPDQIKIYPTIVLNHSKLYQIWKKNKYHPYPDKRLKNLLKEIKLMCPPYVRIARLFRDIPKQSIYGGLKITNIRQMIQEELKSEKKYCQCIRCREARGQQVNLKEIKLIKREYQASLGKEIFLSFETKDKKTIYAFCRLRFPANRNKNHFIPVLRNSALIRELHTYGELIPLSSKKGKIQHKGFGKRLMEKAESLSKKAGYKKIAVIAGIGVREYYRKLGYKLQDEYMVKKIS